MKWSNIQNINLHIVALKYCLYAIPNHVIVHHIIFNFSLAAVKSFYFIFCTYMSYTRNWKISRGGLDFDLWLLVAVMYKKYDRRSLCTYTSYDNMPIFLRNIIRITCLILFIYVFIYLLTFYLYKSHCLQYARLGFYAF